MKKYYIYKKSAGYSCKSFSDENKAREYADACCKANNNEDYIVCKYDGGCFVEI